MLSKLFNSKLNITIFLTIIILGVYLWFTYQDYKEIVWAKSPDLGIFYPSRYKMNESSGTPRGDMPYFSTSYGRYIIHMQEKCDESKFGEFNYGVDSETCLRGLKASVFNLHSSRSLTDRELKIFGDFINKNK